MSFKNLQHILYVLVFLVTSLFAEKIYYDTGELKQEVHHKNGKRHGLSTLYYKTGKVKYTADYVDGKRINKTYYYTTGEKPLPTKITNTKTDLTLLSYGYIQEQNNHFYKARMAYETVCDDGNLNGCFYLGLIGDRLMKTRDMKMKAKVNGYPKAAYEMWQKACDEKHDAVACRDLGRLYDMNGGYDLSKKYYQKACTSNAKEGCIGLSLLYENGKGVMKNRAEALKYLNMACDAKKNSACYKLGSLHKYYSEFEQANYFFKIACDDGDMKGCSSLGRAYQWGLGINEVPKKAKMYYEKACNNGYMFSCMYLADLAMPKAYKNNDYSVVLALETKACDGGISTACNYLGNYFEKIDSSKALSYYKKGCMMTEDEVSCSNAKQTRKEMRK